MDPDPTVVFILMDPDSKLFKLLWYYQCFKRNFERKIKLKLRLKPMFKVVFYLRSAAPSLRVLVRLERPEGPELP